MLPFLCAIAIGSQGIEFNLPVYHVRASRIADILKGKNGAMNLFMEPLQVDADDVKSVITVRGSADQVLQAREIVKMFDVEAKRVKMTLHVDSPVDKLAYDVTTTIRNQSVWEMTENDTGLTFTISPRINADGTITSAIHFKSGGGESQVVFRLKPKAKITIPVGTTESQEIIVGKDVSVSPMRTIPGPTVTLSFELEDSKGK
ncbi:hypothetical protein BH11ARM1_BH11ARM1_12800 [soil metagenome]